MLEKFNKFYSAVTFVQGMSDFKRAWHKTEQLMGTHILFLHPVLQLQNTSLITLSLRAGWSDIMGTSLLSTKWKHFDINSDDCSSKNGTWALRHMKACEQVKGLSGYGTLRCYWLAASLQAYCMSGMFGHAQC